MTTAPDTAASPCPITAHHCLSEDAEWWRSSVVYQIYPRSFADSNGDGIGDLRGIIDHLDYIADLGVDVIWISPIYPSPQDDNGYDISDYQNIDPVFGSLDDFDELLTAAHDRGLKVIMDLVVNHTSDEHPWFIESASSVDNPKRDWYIWRDPAITPGSAQMTAEPNNWGSFFSGSAWEYTPAREQYYLHLFSKKQPDLNWDNIQVREAIYAMMRWWLDRGIDGFRMDVINFLSKDPSLPDGAVTNSGYGDGSPHFSYGPHIHDYLAEMQEHVFAGRDKTYLTVGEMPGVTVEQALRFTDRQTGQLDMVFQFEHVDLDHFDSKWDYKPVGSEDLKHSLGRWQEGLGTKGWNSLYWNNHDQPRVVSRFGDDTHYHYESATALATVLHLQRGTPYIYQGEELGMTNVPFDSIEEFRDIETLNAYAAAQEAGADLASLLTVFRRKSRDNARTPFQWNASTNAGFTTGTPWISINPAHTSINAEQQQTDSRSVRAFYKDLIALRHTNPVIVYGDFQMLHLGKPELYAYTRTLEGTQLIVVANLAGEHADAAIEGTSPENLKLLITNYETPPRYGEFRFRPWEARVLISRQ